MKKKLIIIISLLFILNFIKGQEKIFYDANKNIINNINWAVEYTITEKCVFENDSLIKINVFYISGKKKSEYSILNEYKKENLKEQKFIGEKKEWFENGNIHLKAFYNDGKLHDEFCTYWPNGIQRRKDYFENGKLIQGNCYDSIGNRLFEYFPYETAPQFPGGENKLFRFLGKEVRYPAQAQENNIQGRVITEFYVEADGKITDIKIIKNVNFYLDIEALRVINAMPDWTPGTLEGQKVRAKITLPINFRVQ